MSPAMAGVLEHIDPTLFELEQDLSTAELRDPGLYPGFHYFVSNVLMGYLAHAPGRINALFSAYDILHRGTLRLATAMVPFARELFLDSGCISALMACAGGKLDKAEVVAWLRLTPELCDLAWKLHDGGAPPGVLAAMDLPAYTDMLEPAGFTVESAERVTLENAALMREQPLPPGWRPVYTSQGLSLEDHQRCMDGYTQLGIIDDIRRGRAWLAIGGMAFEDSNDRVWTVHRWARQYIGEVGHIHALGVTRPDVLIPMIRRGWVNSADSSSPVQEVRFNRGPYQVNAPRPSFLVNALHASASLYAEAQLAQALAKAMELPDYQQEELFG